MKKSDLEKLLSGENTNMKFLMKMASDKTFADNYDNDKEGVLKSFLDENNLNLKPQVSMNADKLKNKSKIPQEILESIISQPIDIEGGNTLDVITKKISEKPVHKEVIKEEKKENNTPIYTNNNVNIDYSLIKTIVEETIKKYSSALKRSILTEVKNNTVTEGNNNLKIMSVGENLRLITEDGDVYEAELVYKGKIKK